MKTLRIYLELKYKKQKPKLKGKVQQSLINMQTTQQKK